MERFLWQQRVYPVETLEVILEPLLLEPLQILVNGTRAKSRAHCALAGGGLNRIHFADEAPNAANDRDWPKRTHGGSCQGGPQNCHNLKRALAVACLDVRYCAFIWN
jgi:hypothetical protein